MMDKFSNQKIAIPAVGYACTIIFLCICLNVYFLLRSPSPSLGIYITVGIDVLTLTALLYTQLRKYLRKQRYINDAIAKATKIAPKIIEKGIPESEAVNFALGIYLSCPPEDADLLISTFIEGNPEDLLNLLMQNYKSSHTIIRNYPTNIVQPQLRKPFGAKFSELMDQTDTELQRLKWTFDEAENHLIGLYDVRSRFLLTEAQLEDFLLYLQSQ